MDAAEGRDAAGGHATGARLADAAWIAAAVALAGIELGGVPGFDRSWGPTLWRYLAPAHAFALAALVLLLCIRPLRVVVARRCAGIPRTRRVGALALVALPCVLFALRERLAFGDSRIIYFTMNANPITFFFPDIGATFFLQMGHRIGRVSGIGGLELVQALICAMAPIAVYTLYRAVRLMVDGSGRALVVLALVLGTGLVRVFAGHLEVYSFVLAATGGYLWAAFAYLRGRCSWTLPALAFGIGLWVHVQYLFLIPSLMLLFVLREPHARPAATLRRWLAAGALALLPSLLFFALLLAFGHAADLEAAVAKMLSWSTVGPSDGGHEAWIRLWGEAGAGTRYRIFGAGHLKYLANAFFVLSPWTLPVIAIFALRDPRALLATHESRFLLVACASMWLYAAIVRPVYGPYDWDLFSLTAVLHATLAGHLLTRALGDDDFDRLATGMIGSALLFVALPLLVVGIAPVRDAGPFSRDLSVPVRGEAFDASFERQVAPWL